MRNHTHSHSTRRPKAIRRVRTNRSRRSSGLTAAEMVLLVLCLLAVVGAFLASAGPALPTGIESRAIRVEPGQTLWDLAQTHSVDGLSTADTVELIRSMNALSDSRIAADILVLVPTDSSLQTALATR